MWHWVWGLVWTGLSAASQTEAPADIGPTFATPALLTSAGQTADVLIVKGLAARAAVEVRYSPFATGDSLVGVGSVILVAGGSSKGLGAAKVDPDKELQRVKSVVAKARAAKIPIVTLHIGGEARRGALSDPFNRLAAQEALVLVVLAAGDSDGFFRKIAAEKKSRYIGIEKQIDVLGVLRDLFQPSAAPLPTERPAGG